MPGYQNTQLPVSPMPQQPTGFGGGAQEAQMMQIMQMLAQKASDPQERMRMAQALASKMPPPPDNIFGHGMKAGSAPGLPQQQPQSIPNFSGLGAMMQPQPASMPAGMMMPGGNGQAAITMVPTNGPAAFGMPQTNGMRAFQMPMIPMGV